LEKNPIRKRQLGRNRLRWEDLIENNSEELGGEEQTGRRELSIEMTGR